MHRSKFHRCAGAAGVGAGLFIGFLAAHSASSPSPGPAPTAAASPAPAATAGPALTLTGGPGAAANATPWTLSSDSPPPALAGPSASPDNTKFVAPKLLKRVSPGYPVLASLNRVEGIVRVRLSVDESGHVIKVALVRRQESPLLDDVARDRRLLDWTFQPATLDGKPVPADYETELDFRTDAADQRAIALRRMSKPLGTPDPPYPEAAKAAKLRGTATITVKWSKAGFVDRILLIKSTDSYLLDTAAVRFAYENWRIDPAQVTQEPFTKTVHFDPPP